MEQERPPKETFAERYRVVAPIGKGGMGAVWRGEHLVLGTPVAIKLLDKRLADRSMIRARFLREARAAASLRSKHVVQIFDHGIEDDIPYIVMECLEGESLGLRLRNGGRLEPAAMMRILAQVGAAVSRAHKAGIVHRDLKPDNIFLARDEEGHEVVKVLDFGIAKVMEDEAAGELSTDTGALLGTPYYMSPEQARGIKPLDHRADLWALSVIAFECLVGRRAFNAQAVGELILQICSGAPPIPSSIATVPAGFDAWFERATRKAIGERFQTVEELLETLRKALSLEDTVSDALADSGSSPDPAAPARAVTGSVDTGARAAVSNSVETDPTVLAAPPAPTDANSVQSVKEELKPRRSGMLWIGVAVGVVGAGALVWFVGRDPSSGAVPSASTAVATSPAPAVTTAVPSIRGAASVESVTRSATASTSASESASASATVTSQTVKLTIATNEGEAAVYRGKDRLGTTSDALELPRGKDPVVLTIKKKGFAPATLNVVPDKDRDERVTLKAAPDKEYQF